MRVLPIVLLTAASSISAAEPRQTFVTAVGGYALAAPPNATTSNEFNHGPVVGVSVALDHAPPEYNRTPGARVGRADLVPEASLLATEYDHMVLAGVRLQVSLAEYQVGLFQLSSRSKIWLAPRVGISSKGSGAVYGGDFGLSFHTASGLEIGGYTGFYTWMASVADLPDGYVEDMSPTTDTRMLQFQLGLLVSSTTD